MEYAQPQCVYKALVYTNTIASNIHLCQCAVGIYNNPVLISNGICLYSTLYNTLCVHVYDLDRKRVATARRVQYLEQEMAFARC